MADTPAHRGRTHRSVAMWAGLALATVALAPPIDHAADRSLTLHMVQHVLLLTAAPPLIVFGASLRRSRSTSSAVAVVAALLAVSVAMVGWHLPVLYDAAVTHTMVHIAQHLSYLATSIAFWWVIGLGDTPGGAAVLVVFIAAFPGSAVGATLTLASRPLYRSYPSLADQQLAGVVMWAFAGLAYVLAAAITFALWLRAAERSSPQPMPKTTHG